MRERADSQSYRFRCPRGNAAPQGLPRRSIRADKSKFPQDLPFSAVCRIDFLLDEERVSITTGDGRTYDAYPNFTIRRYMLSNIAQAMAFEADLAFAQESPACGSYGAWSLYLEPAMPMGSSVQQTVYGVLRDDEAQVAYLWSIGVPLRTLPGFPPDDHAALQNLLDTLRAGEICGRICAAWDTR